MEKKAATGFIFVFAASLVFSAAAQPMPKGFPSVQAEPLPHDQVSFQHQGRELARYHFASNLVRPFLFPVNGPSGRSLTRMGHPHDPITHSHHNSIWISHRDVNGVNFWEDRGQARILHRAIEQFQDGPEEASVTTINHWLNGSNEVMLVERRRVTTRPLSNGEWLLLVDMELKPQKKSVVLGKTPFGIFAVRVAKTLGVNDGGGEIRNSEGGVNEAGVFWKQARWVDYSGPLAENVIEGVTLMDHPTNPNHPATFHVRNDGWMGASLTFGGPLTLAETNVLKLRYGLLIHRGKPPAKDLEKQWESFSKLGYSPLAGRSK